MDAFGDLAAVTLHLARADRCLVLLDDRGAKLGRISFGAEIRIDAANGALAAAAGPRRGGVRTVTRGDARPGPGAPERIRTGPGRAAIEGPFPLVQRWPLLQLRAAIPESIATPDGRPRARILAAALGVRLELAGDAQPDERLLAILLYAAATRQAIPPPSAARYLVPRAL